MAKVKKMPRVTGVRNVKASKKANTRKTGAKAARTKPAVKRPATERPKSSKAKAPTRRPVRGPSKRKKVKVKKTPARKTALQLLRGKKKGRPVPPPPVVRVAVKELDPQRMCGRETTVQFLYRVDETVDGRSTAHLVFFDRHGWYCEHGRTCPAVGHARKYNGRIARVS